MFYIIEDTHKPYFIIPSSRQHLYKHSCIKMGLCFSKWCPWKSKSQDIPIYSSDDDQIPKRPNTAPQRPQQRPHPPPPPPPPPHRVSTILRKPYTDVTQFYNLDKELGRGQFGITYLCSEKTTGMKYACKSISKRKLATEKDKEDARREILILEHLSGQPNIVEFKGAFEDKDNIHLVMELCSGNVSKP